MLHGIVYLHPLRMVGRYMVTKLNFLFVVFQVITKFVKARTILLNKVLNAKEISNETSAVEELKEIQLKIKEYENKARAKCMNIETESGKNESLVANFDEFIRNWEKHVKLGEEKKRKQAAQASQPKNILEGPLSHK